MIADAPPPPLQILAIPNLPLFCLNIIIYINFKTVIRLKTILAPELPNGCPNAIAPPLIFTLSIGISSNFIFARAVAAKASFIS